MYIDSEKFVVGLTGGIASGKSTLANFFHELGITVVSADEVARCVMHANSDLVVHINAVFAKEFNAPNLLESSGHIDRALLREIIFNQPIARRRLDELTHPVISQELVKRIMAATSPYVLAEIPLLIEANMQELVNRVLVIESDKDTQITRVMQRDAVSAGHAEKIINAQLSNSERRAYADDSINNTGSLDKARNQVKILHQRYLQLAKNTSPLPGLDLS